MWFDNQAEEAVNFYTSIFENSKIGSAARYDEEGSKAAGRPKGSVMTVAFQLVGQDFVALNGGPVFKFTEAVSFVVLQALVVVEAGDLRLLAVDQAEVLHDGTSSAARGVLELLQIELDHLHHRLQDAPGLRAVLALEHLHHEDGDDLP